MNQDTIELMKTIIKMESAIARLEPQLESLAKKSTDMELELDEIRIQLKNNIKKLSISINQ